MKSAVGTATVTAADQAAGVVSKPGKVGEYQILRAKRLMSAAPTPKTRYPA
jgi:hypothetical protein